MTDSLHNTESAAGPVHTAAEIRAEYDRLDRLLGLDTSDVEIVISRRRGRQLGSFRSPRTGTAAAAAARPLRITISATAMEDDALFWDTIRHEYAHLAVYLLYPGERHGHDAVWQAVCRTVGCAPKGTVPATEGQRRGYESQARYRVRCPQCGAETYYQRAGKIVKLLAGGRRGAVTCMRCGCRRLELYVRE